MPHLKYSGRFWRLASDELFFPGIVAIIARVFWSVIMIIILVISAQRLSRCPDGEGLLAYLFLSLIVFVLSILCEAIMVKKSLVGSMVETGKREVGLAKFLTAHIVLGSCQLVLAIFGMFVISSHSTIPCVSDFKSYQNYDVILLSVVVITQFVDITSLMCCCYAFSAAKEDDSHLQDEHYAATLWEGRCKTLMNCLQVCSCNIFGGSNVEEDLNTVARVLTNFFHHDGFLDVVPSDVVAGIILVRIQQRARRLPSYTNLANYSLNASTPSFITPSALSTIQDSRTIKMDLEETIDGGERECTYQHYRSNSSSVSNRKDLDRRVPEDQQLVENIAKYSVYMIAIYTHLLAIFMQPCTGLCCLCCSRCQSSRRSGRLRSGSSSGAGAPLGCADYLCCLQRRNVKQDQLRLRSASTNLSPQRIVPTVKGDNCCGANHAGLIHFTKDIDAEVIFASYVNDTVAKPYAVFLNHDQQSVVVAVRGSLSLEDAITDVLADPVEMVAAGERWGFDGRGKYAHGGFFQVAQYILEELDRNQVLRLIYDPNCMGSSGSGSNSSSNGGSSGNSGGSGSNGSGVGSGCCSEGSLESGFGAVGGCMNSSGGAGASTNVRAPLHPTHPLPYAHYQLVIVGHSLGAAAAAILSYMLRPRHPRVHCYGYGLPGCVFDPHTAAECSEFITAVVIDCDWVPRMSLHSVTRLREEILDSISRARVHKLMILQAMFKDFDANAMMYPPGDEPDSEFKRSVAAFKAAMSQRLATGDGLAFSGSTGGPAFGSASAPASSSTSASTSPAAFTAASSSSFTAASSSSISHPSIPTPTAPLPHDKPRLCLPGRVVHLVKSDQEGFFCHAKAVYTPMHAPNADFLELMMSPNMAWDHFPDRYFVEVNRLYETWR